jgi:hypothetical protein
MPNNHPLKYILMRRSHLPIACLFVVCGLLSCNNSEEETSPPPPPLPNTSSTPAVSNQPQPVITGGLNPAHGTPGHRCDIAVGAPFNSAPANKVPATAVMQAPQPVQMSAPSQAAPNNSVNTVAAPTTASGFNPAHGQPGHRCDIAVGAPLNSAPANKTPSTQSPVQTITPVQPANTGSTAKLNPAHGQPGHDCTIPVGQPLKQ